MNICHIISIFVLCDCVRVWEESQMMKNLTKYL